MQRSARIWSRLERTQALDCTASMGVPRQHSKVSKHHYFAELLRGAVKNGLDKHASCVENAKIEQKNFLKN